MVTEVPKGYKRTEVGVIPKDWDIDFVGNLASITTGSKNTQDKREDGQYPFFVRSQIAERINSFSYDGEAVLTAGDGVGTGKVFHYINGKFDYHQRVYKISDFKKKLDGKFFYFYFSNHFYARIMQMTAKSSVDSIRMEMIADMQIPLPSYSEQKEISTALNDIALLVDDLGMLIRKKKNLKKGVMHELLTGKKRLIGFKDKWIKKRLGEIAEIRDGTHQTPEYVASGIPFYSVENVTANDFKKTKFISEKEHSVLTKSYRIEKGDILMTRIGSIGDCKYVYWDVNASFYVSLALLKVKKGYSPQFIAHYSQSAYFKKEIELNSLQSAIPKKINLGQISNVNLEIPETQEEQQAIALILSDMDVEIEELEQKLDKYKAIKQGLMQELLTGKRRLVTAE
ncbi:MAG: EcoKI restriction-modification system protein HsdS [Smithella sp. PtaU1.Bin162]|nr:MAG: EcoKI restriction-modification system protein HsdS [Smithella sp. PtaU1.Bin162]